MVRSRRRLLLAFSAMLLPLGGAGCGGSGPPAPESLTKEAKVDGMSVVLNVKNQKAPEVSWVVTDRVVADFSGNHVEVAKNQVTSGGKVKKLPPRTELVTIDYENNEVTIRANGTPILGPGIK